MNQIQNVLPRGWSIVVNLNPNDGSLTLYRPDADPVVRHLPAHEYLIETIEQIPALIAEARSDAWKWSKESKE